MCEKLSPEFADAVDAFIEHLMTERGALGATLRAYASDAAEFGRFCCARCERTAAEVSRESVDSWVQRCARLPKARNDRPQAGEYPALYRFRLTASRFLQPRRFSLPDPGEGDTERRGCRKASGAAGLVTPPA